MSEGGVRRPAARQAASAVTRDGTRIGYALAGEGRDGMVLVHSLAMDGTFWQPVLERLPPQLPVLVPDCRGHGRSDRPPGPYTVELFARDLADLLDHVGWRSALVAGASMGGCVALGFAAAYPQRTRALGLIDTTAWYGPQAPAQWEERARKAVTDGLPSLVGFQAGRWFGDGFRERHSDIVQATVGTFLRNDVAAYVETCRMLGACDLRPALPALDVPTAVVVGEEDYATPPAMAEALQRGIAGATLTVLPGARHFTPIEQPDRIAAELLALQARSVADGRR